MLAFVIVVIVLAAVAVAVVASFFVRRHGEAPSPEAGWTPTDEVFRDPGTNRTMRVWLDASGERHYVPDRRR